MVCGNTTRYSTFSARIAGCNQNDAAENNLHEPGVNTKSGLNAVDKVATSCEVFPNPSHGDITIVFSEPADITMIQVFNNLGVLTEQEGNFGENQRIRLKILSVPGIYLLVIRLGDSGIIRKKVVID